MIQKHVKLETETNRLLNKTRSIILANNLDLTSLSDDEAIKQALQSFIKINQG